MATTTMPMAAVAPMKIFALAVIYSEANPRQLLLASRTFFLLVCRQLDLRDRPLSHTLLTKRLRKARPFPRREKANVTPISSLVWYESVITLLRSLNLGNSDAS